MNPLKPRTRTATWAAIAVLVTPLTLLLIPGCDDGGPSGPPDEVFVDIFLDPDTRLPAVDPDPVQALRGRDLKWRSAHGGDTAWVVQLTAGSPFVRGTTRFESNPSNPSTPVGTAIRHDVPVGSVYPYYVKIIVNEGADTLGVDPEIHVRDPN